MQVVEKGVVVVEEDAVEDDGLVPCLVFGCVSSGRTARRKGPLFDLSEPPFLLLFFIILILIK